MEITKEQLKRELTKVINSDRSTKAQWIYKRITDKVMYKIDQLL